MRTRVRKLREQTVRTEPFIAPERAVLITEFYKNDTENQSSTTVLRALAFKHVLENKKIYIGEGELIVGERGPAPKAVPTYPEICCHSFEDLEVLSTRKKTPYFVDKETKRIYREDTIPYWKDTSIRNVIFSKMSQEWKAAYEAGIFTEFLEQRAPGHTVLDNKIYNRGLLDFKKDIARSMERLDFRNDSEAYKKAEELKAMEIAADALIRYAERHAEKARELQKREKNRERRKELKKIADVCTHVPAHAPRNFWEAIQCYWFIHLGVVTELNPWDSFNPGRLDQHLYSFYRRGLEDGSLTQEDAKELLQLLWIKFNNHPPHQKSGSRQRKATPTTISR